VAQRLRARFPGIKTAIIQVDQSPAHNPKVNKLARLEEQSDAPLIWVLDSDVRVGPQTLRALVGEHLNRGANMVFSPIRCQGARTFGSIIEMCYVNFFMSGSILTAWKLFHQRVIVGKSLLIERKALDAVAGFMYFADVLAEDYWLGETFPGMVFQCDATTRGSIRSGKLRQSIIFSTGWAAGPNSGLIWFRPVYLLEILFIRSHWFCFFCRC